jgi:hypothetical protein
MGRATHVSAISAAAITTSTTTAAATSSRASVRGLVNADSAAIEP